MTVPSEIPNWATTNFPDPITGQPNVVTPPPEKQDIGWSFGEFPPRQWFNWLGRWTAAWINYFAEQQAQNVTTDGAGVALFPIDDALITLTAVDSANPGRYLFAVGYKPAGGVPVLNVVDSATLTLGTGTITGDQPVNGGSSAANTIVYGNSKVTP